MQSDRRADAALPASAKALATRGFFPVDPGRSLAEYSALYPGSGVYIESGATEMVRQIGEDASERKLLADIAEFGWHCVHIMAEGELVEYSFTVGLFQTYRHPELIVFGLPSSVAHQILSNAVHEAQLGVPIDLSLPSDALLNSYSCCFVEVPASEYHEHVGFARWYYQGNNFPLVQVVWPSRSGLFPWRADAAPEFRVSQPVLGVAAGGT